MNPGPPVQKNSRISAFGLRMENVENVLELFEGYLILERSRFKGTVRDYVRTIKYILKTYIFESGWNKVVDVGEGI